MPRIQLIIEAESARHLASVINQMAHRYKPDDEAVLEPNEPSTKSNGADAQPRPAATEIQRSLEQMLVMTPNEAEQEAKTAEEQQPAPVVSAPKRSHKKKAEAPPVIEPEQEPEAPPEEIPALDDIKNAITKAVVAEPHGGPIRTALETLRPSIGITLVRNAKEEHRAALWKFAQQHGIEIPAQV